MLANRVMIISFALMIVFTITICSLSSSQESDKVAVLYFTDHSRFDSGGGCLSFWPLNVIFGTGQKRERWDLKSGFRDMLNEKLTEAGYNIVEPGHVDVILRETGGKNLSKLADKLGADIMIIGDIKKFQQHRTRASSQGPTMLDSGETMSMSVMGGIGGFFYSATVKTDIAIYDSSGDELDRAEINSKKDLRDFYMGVGPMTYHRGDTNEKDDKPEPIVDYEKLDKMKFGTDEFKNKTLFGMATMDTIDKIVAKVQEHSKPAELTPVQGKIVYVGTADGRVKENQVYIDLGAGDGIKTGNKLGVYIPGLQLTDPDTGKELGKLAEEKIGVIKVSKVEADHLSLAEIVEKTGQIERGNIVRRESDKEIR